MDEWKGKLIGLMRGLEVRNVAKFLEEKGPSDYFYLGKKYHEAALQYKESCRQLVERIKQDRAAYQPFNPN